ncbi:MAG: hypothetical protein A3D28_05450 [Omnitrophica bacterium RIFCSPHIGHO2_02_FULL_63_14]|nr:MAG: hypothetical protein A3D28_05450 [Omnitrophica bacterium RIFCSPHIGHO2_02_FULL_63_14]
MTERLLALLRNRTLILAVVAGVAGTAIGWNLMLKKQVGTLRATRIEIKSQIEREKALKSIVELNGQAKAFDALYAPSKEMSWFIDAVSLIADESNVTLLSVTPQTGSVTGPSSDFIRVEVRLDAKGGYHAVGRFTSRLESYRTFIKLQSVAMTNPVTLSTGKTELGLGLLLTAFYPVAESQPQ